jgi:hypothetical protein
MAESMEGQSAAGSNTPAWYERATVRTSPRILVPQQADADDIFPRTRQPLVDHPIVQALGTNAIRYLLCQSAYHYMYQIRRVETKFIIDCALKIANKEIHPAATDEARLDALTVVIDEAFHAHVALDFSIQLEFATQIDPIAVPSTAGGLDAFHRYTAKLSKEAQPMFELVAVCLAEHLITKDLASIGKERNAMQSFTQVMVDHVADEGRHAGYFARLVMEAWACEVDSVRSEIGRILPDYLDDFLAFDRGRTFDRQLLGGLGLDREEIENVLKDTDDAYVSGSIDHIAKTKLNLVKLLDRMGVLDHGTQRTSFAANQLLA